MSKGCIKAVVVLRRPSTELIQSLRVTLQKIEESFASQEDQPRVAELRRILLQRIAELESADKSNSTDEPEVGSRLAPQDHFD